VSQEVIMVCARLVLAALAALSIGATRAEARVWVGVGVPLYYGPPVYVPPPVYYPPPVIYAPPPGYYGPPPGSTFNYTPPSAMPQSYPPQGYAPQGYPPSGYPPSGYPPPGYGAPRGVTPQSYTPSMGNGPTNLNLSCHAGIYTCPLVEDTPPGGQCACPNEKGGTIAGRAS
jgi:XYPPX repeat (two copies)